VLAIRAWNGVLTSIVVCAFRLTLRLFRAVPGAVLIIDSLIGVSVMILSDALDSFFPLGTVEGDNDSRTSFLHIVNNHVLLRCSDLSVNGFRIVLVVFAVL